MKRKELTNTQWNRLKPLLPPQKPQTGRPALAHRRVINGILWILRTGAPWRDLPRRYGCWSTVASRFYRWQKAGIWQRLFEAVQQQADAKGNLNWDVHYVDGTIVRAHQHAAGSPRGAEAEALGRSQGGFSTKVHLRAADDKHVMTFVLSPGQRHEALGFEALMAGGAVKRRGRGRPKQRPGRLVGDKAYSSRHIRAYLRRHGIRITIPHKVNEHRSGPFDRAMYRTREQVERLINRLKQNRRIATRYEKCAANYRAMWLIAATLLWLEHEGLQTRPSLINDCASLINDCAVSAMIRHYQDLCRGLMIRYALRGNYLVRRCAPGGETRCYVMWTSSENPDGF